MFTNLTPHVVVIRSVSGKLVHFLPSGEEAKVTVKKRLIGSLAMMESDEHFPIYITTYTDVVGVPNQIEGKYLIVSDEVRQAMPHRNDLLSPGELIRDIVNKPIGNDGFEVNPLVE